jgi:hypothetical protein
MKFTLYISILIFCQNLYCQSDTLFIDYPGLSNENTIVTDIINSTNGYCFLLYNFQDTSRCYSLIETDYNGEVSRLLDEILLNNDCLDNIQYLHKITEGYLILANTKLSDKNVFISIIINDDLTQITLIDSLSLEDGVGLYFNDFKLSNRTGHLESFGTIRNLESDQINSNIYVELDLNGYFMYSDVIDLVFPPINITDFVEIPEDSTHFVSFIDASSVLVSNDFTVMRTMDNRFTYTIGDIEYDALFRFSKCGYSEDNLICTGTSGIENEYNFSLCRINYSLNKLEVEEIYSLLPVGTSDDIVTGTFTIDSFGNYVSACSGFMWPFGDEVDVNSIYVAKLSPDFEPLWKLEFNNSTEDFVRDIITDEYNNIAIVGEHWSNEFFGQRHGFLLKVYEDGQLTGIEESLYQNPILKLYPNPAQTFIHVNFSSPSDIRFKIYNAQGLMVKESEIQGNANQVDIGALLPGTYVISLYGRNGELLASNRFSIIR